MHDKITMEMSICQAENGFSLDELVKNVADAYEKKAFADILKMNLQQTQEVLMYRGICIYICHKRSCISNCKLQQELLQAVGGAAVLVVYLEGNKTTGSADDFDFAVLISVFYARIPLFLSSKIFSLAA